jgi:adsorption protein B
MQGIVPAELLNGLRLALQTLQIVEQELLLFAAFWFVVGAVDELAVDLSWLWLRLTGRAVSTRLTDKLDGAPLEGRVAVFVPAWREASVIGAMIAHTLRAWPQSNLRLYVGCYANDSDTFAAAIAGANSDPRLRIVVHDRTGPTTKADCLNRLYAALCEDERRLDTPFASILLHDAEDMVHPAALPVMDRALAHVEFVQIPVRPEPQPRSHWISGHYSDEFTEAHAKTMVVRDLLGAAIPAAGVGCGFARSIMADLARVRTADGESGPFATECLTEDYELGLLVARGGARSRFLRLRDHDGQLIATRAFFPERLDDAVRQKARWVHGIALQGWDRLGWDGRLIEIWMALRDRRGPLTAVVLAAAYGLLVIEAILALAHVAGWRETMAASEALRLMLAASFLAFIWRVVWRFAFTAHEYGAAEGFRSILRIPVGNVIAIMSGRRALAAYLRGLRGEIVNWDKTSHHSHPASLSLAAVPVK